VGEAVLGTPDGRLATIAVVEPSARNAESGRIAASNVGEVAKLRPLERVPPILVATGIVCGASSWE